MPTPITGRCYCGGVTFQIAEPPVVQRSCWCRDCQYLSCGNASVNLMCVSASVSVEGKVAEYVSTADSGNTMRRRFCPTCGTQLFSASDARPEYVVVRAGALDDPELGKPTAFIWTRSTPSWGLFDQALPCFETSAPTVKSA